MREAECSWVASKAAAKAPELLKASLDLTGLGAFNFYSPFLPMAGPPFSKSPRAPQWTEEKVAMP